MARINLLPWRAERRASRQKEFYVMLGAAALAGFVLSALIWLYYGYQISGQHERNRFLESEITKVESQIKEIDELDKKKSRLLARKDVIEQLQANRSQMVHLFDSLVRTIPDGVTLTSIKQEGDLLTLEGRTQSNARVSSYMRNLETSGWMTKPDLAVIEAKNQEKEKKAATVTASGSELPYMFSLQVKLANPNATDADGQEPAAPGTDPAGTPAATPPSPSAAPAVEAPAAQEKAEKTEPATPVPAKQASPAS